VSFSLVDCRYIGKGVFQKNRKFIRPKTYVTPKAITIVCVQIVVLDEATSSLDSETAARIHDTIRQTFCDCTLIVIAHSMHTVLQCDRVLVIDQGQVFASISKSPVGVEQFQGLNEFQPNSFHIFFRTSCSSVPVRRYCCSDSPSN